MLYVRFRNSAIMDQFVTFLEQVHVKNICQLLNLSWSRGGQADSPKVFSR